MPTVTFKVTPEQAREIRRAARRMKLTVSDYLRRRALAVPSAALTGLKPSNRPGCVVIPQAVDAPTVTSEMIAAALYD
jgi:hypothetical protein